MIEELLGKNLFFLSRKCEYFWQTFNDHEHKVIRPTNAINFFRPRFPGSTTDDTDPASEAGRMFWGAHAFLARRAELVSAPLTLLFQLGDLKRQIGNRCL